MTHVIQTKHKEAGQSMVELALTITILMVLLAGTIDLGRAFFTWLAMRDAAQEGASYGIIVPPSSTLTCDKNTSAPFPPICARVWDNLTNVVKQSNINTVITVSINSSPCFGNTIQVDVNYPAFPLSMPFLGTILGSQSIPIHATVNDTILASCN